MERAEVRERAKRRMKGIYREKGEGLQKRTEKSESGR